MRYVAKVAIVGQVRVIAAGEEIVPEDVVVFVPPPANPEPKDPKESLQAAQARVTEEARVAHEAAMKAEGKTGSLRLLLVKKGKATEVAEETDLKRSSEPSQEVQEAPRGARK